MENKNKNATQMLESILRFLLHKNLFFEKDFFLKFSTFLGKKKATKVLG
jgi:hypothetical protein